MTQNGQKSKFWKTIENVSWYRPKDHIFKTLGSYAKNYAQKVKNSIKSSKIKNVNITTLHAKNFDCRSNGVTCGQYKDKEDKNSEMFLNARKTSKTLCFSLSGGKSWCFQ